MIFFGFPKDEFRIFARFFSDFCLTKNTPERILPGSKRKPRKQVYHFLTGDPGMANFTDKVIKSLAPEKNQAMKDWNRKFNSPHSEDDILMLIRLSAIIDDLWSKQVELRKSVNEQTADALSVYGHEDTLTSYRTTIREKDLLFKRLYKSEEMNNAGPYARLKFAMDYWCSLWFWPIEQAELLPSRSEFLFDMSLILEGGIVSVAPKQSKVMSLFPTEIDEMAHSTMNLYQDLAEVDLAALCERNPRLKLAKEIANANKFMHWELEFADLFEERGGFDLVIGNPPWIKAKWDEQAVLSDIQPLFSIKEFTAPQIVNLRRDILDNEVARNIYLSEYEHISGILNYLNAFQNYFDLQGIQTNYYKCFLEMAIDICHTFGTFSFIHPDGIFDDSNGGLLRKKLYPKLRKHFHFINEKLLFAEVGHPEVFSLNIYCNSHSQYFEMISNLFDPCTIEECYEEIAIGLVPGIKDEFNNWNLKGHPDRRIVVSQNELKLFTQILDDSDDCEAARLPVIHAKQLIKVLSCFANQKNTIHSLGAKFFSTELWHETETQKNGTINCRVRFPEKPIELILSGPHIGLANPFFQTSRAICEEKGDYDNVDLTNINDRYLNRSKYTIGCDVQEYIDRSPSTSWGTKYITEYKLLSRKMLNLKQERTLMSAIFPPHTGHINGVFGICFDELDILLTASALFASIPYDYFIKCLGKTNLYDNVVGKLPIIVSAYSNALLVRSFLLNSLSIYYSDLWKRVFKNSFTSDKWSKVDSRLHPERFSTLTKEWKWESALRSDYERRQAFVEIDVLSSMALGMTLEQLISVYRIQFPVLKANEADTWYDRKGRIVFTKSRSLTNVGYSRAEWNEIKDAPSGTFTRTITDDTMPGGPIERTIEYVAPFDRCDREQDYETAWAFFAERFKNQ